MRTHAARRDRRRLPDPLLHLRRHPRVRLALCVTLFVLAGLLVQRSLAAGAAERDAWGRSVEVLVATRELAAGDGLAGAVEARELPAGLVPESALRGAPGTRVARAAIYAGEVVLAARVAPDGLTGLAARVPADHRAVAVPVEAGAVPQLRVGDRVDVLAALDPAAAGDGPPAFAVAESATVVAVADDAVTVAVDDDAVARVAFAITHGLVTLALVGG